MIFGNGCWIQKEGCSCFAPQEVYFTTITDDKVTMCVPTYHVRTRGDVLGNVNLTMEITSPADDILRIRTYHYKGAIKDTPSFELELKDNRKLDINDSEEEIVIKSGQMSLVINKKQFSMKQLLF